MSIVPGWCRAARLGLPFVVAMRCQPLQETFLQILWQVEEFQVGVRSAPPSHRAPEEQGMRKAVGCQKSINAHASILRLQGLDPLSHIAIIDVAAVNFHEIIQSQLFVSGSLVRRR